MRELITVLMFIILIQIVLGFFQIRYYQNFLTNLKNKYVGNKGYYLDVEMVKKIYGSTVVVIVSDENQKIVEAYKYSGISSFAKFSKIDEIVDKSITDISLIDYIKDRGNNTIKALKKIQKKK